MTYALTLFTNKRHGWLSLEDQDAEMSEKKERARRTRETGKLTAQEVIARVQGLEKDAELLAMRNKMRDRWKLYAMLDLPDLPLHFTRGDTVHLPSPRLIHLVHTMLADFASYRTSTTVNPKGPQKKKAADDLEQWLAVVRAKLDDGFRVSTGCAWHQLISAYAVLILLCGEGEFPWEVIVAAPDTCFFTVMGGPLRPAKLGRRYEMLISEIKDTYSGRDRTLSHGQRLVTQSEGEWDWQAMSDDRSIEGGSSLESHPGVDEKAEIYEYYDNDYSYHVVANRDGRNGGHLLWCRENITGGVPAVIVPGLVDEIKGIPDEFETPGRFQPWLWPALQMVKILNLIRTIRATKSLNSKPDAFVEDSQEAIDAAKKLNIARDATELEIEEGGPNLIHIPGKAVLWQTMPDPDLDKLEQGVREELNDYISTAMQLTSEATLQQSTANGILLGVEQRKIQLGPILSKKDWAWGEILKMVVCTIPYYEQEFEFYARGGEGYSKGDVDAAAMVKLVDDPEDVYTDIVVRTASITPSEIRAAVEDWAFRFDRGLSTLKEGITAAGYTNEQGQVEALAKEDGRKIAASAYAASIAAIVADRIRLRWGILAPLAPAPMLAPGGPTGGPGASPMRTPEVQGGQGGGSPVAA